MARVLRSPAGEENRRSEMDQGETEVRQNERPTESIATLLIGTVLTLLLLLAMSFGLYGVMVAVARLVAWIAA